MQRVKVLVISPKKTRKSHEIREISHIDLESS